MKRLKQREDRRARTWRANTRARKQHLRTHHRGEPCTCASGKSAKLGCGCRSRSRGNPKYGHGVCNLSGGVRAAVRERITGKQLCRSFVLEREAIHDDCALHPEIAAVCPRCRGAENVAF